MGGCLGCFWAMGGFRGCFCAIGGAFEGCFMNGMTLGGSMDSLERLAGDGPERCSSGGWWSWGGWAGGWGSWGGCSSPRSASSGFFRAASSSEELDDDIASKRWSDLKRNKVPRQKNLKVGDDEKHVSPPRTSKRFWQLQKNFSHSHSPPAPQRQHAFSASNLLSHSPRPQRQQAYRASNWPTPPRSPTVTFEQPMRSVILNLYFARFHFSVWRWLWNDAHALKTSFSNNQSQNVIFGPFEWFQYSVWRWFLVTSNPTIYMRSYFTTKNSNKLGTFDELYLLFLFDLIFRWTI